MREKLLSALADLALKRPTLVLGVAVALCVLAAIAVPGIRVSTSRFELSEQAQQIDVDEFLAEFGSRNHLIAAVEAEDPDVRYAAADALVSRLLDEIPEADQIFYRIDPFFFRERALLYLPMNDLRRLTEVVEDPSLDLGLFTRLRGLDAMLEGAAVEMERATGAYEDDGAPEDDDDDGGSLVPRDEDGGEDDGLVPRDVEGADPNPDPSPSPVLDTGGTRTVARGGLSSKELEEGGEQLARVLSAIVAELSRWLEDPAASDIRVLEALFESGDLDRSAPIDDQGYLSSRDGRTIYVFIKPTRYIDTYEYVSTLTGGARRIAAEVAAAHPGVSIGFTGYPAIATDDVSAIRRDSLVTGIVSGFAVMLLFAIGFRSLSGVILAGIPLGMGILWSLGLVAVTLGGFNLLTQAAAPVLAGLGIDFGVHLLGRYDGERRRGLDHVAALRASMVSTGKGVLTGAVTTSCAFFTMLVSDYQAFAELGFITGAGLLLVLAGTLTVLPALLTIGERKGWSLLQIHGKLAGSQGTGETGLAAGDEGRHRSASGRLGDRFVEFLLRRPGLSLGIGALVTVVLVMATQRVDFDYDMTGLLPKGAESVEVSRRMVAESDFSSEFVALVANDLDEVRARMAALDALPMIARSESAATFIPEDQDAKVTLLRKIRPVLEDIAMEVDIEALDPITSEGLRATLQRLASASEAAAFLARSRGVEAPAAALDVLAANARAAADRIGAMPGAPARLAAFQTRLFKDLEQYMVLFRHSLSAEPITLTDLPGPIRARFVSTDAAGTTRYAIYAYPEGMIWQRGVLEQFIAEASSVDPKVVGYPLAFLTFLNSMRRSFYEATWFASIVILLLLLADFRNVKHTLMALVPLAFGATWMVGFMGVFEIDYNLANIVALPLVLGIGVDNGVHLVHRYRDEGTTQLAVRRILRALVVSAATTMAGFASLCFASHEGIRSFSVVMVTGVFCSLAAALWILPPMLRWQEARAKGKAA